MNNSTRIHLLITFAATLLYVPFLGSFHLFDWDEINFAEAAREMLVTGDWSRPTIGFEAFWEKPPLFIWLQALSMKIFGVNEFAARLPNAITGIFSLNLFYYIGKRHISHFFGLFFVLAYAGSLAPTLYFKTGIIDPVFNLFIFLSVYQLFSAENSRIISHNPRIHYLLAGIFAGLAVMTKGPVALLLIGLVALVRIIINPRNAWPGIGNLLIIIIPFVFTGALWPVIETMIHGPKFISDFWAYQLTLFGGQIEWHNQPWYYHFIVLFFLCFPAAVFAFPNLIKNQSSVKAEHTLLFSYIRILFWVVLIVFSIVTTKIIHYSSMCWIPLSFMSGYYMYGLHTNREPLNRWLSLPGILAILPVAIAATIAPIMLSGDKKVILDLLQKDLFASAMIINANTWSGFEAITGGLFLIAGLYLLISIGLGKKSAVYNLFFATMLFAQLTYIIDLPRAEKMVQGKLINHISEHNKNEAYLENWHYKSFALLFYGDMKPSDFQGPWNNFARTFESKDAQPKQTGRKFWLMDSNVSKPVFIITKCDYKTDIKFENQFILSNRLGGHILWKRKP